MQKEIEKNEKKEKIREKRTKNPRKKFEGKTPIAKHQRQREKETTESTSSLIVTNQ